MELVRRWPSLGLVTQAFIAMRQWPNGVADSLKEIRRWSGYSVDRRGFYRPGGELGLWTEDPMNRPFWRVPGRFEKKELEDHLLELFPEGLSLHGWQYMLDRQDFIDIPSLTTHLSIIGGKCNLPLKWYGAQHSQK